MLFSFAKCCLATVFCCQLPAEPARLQLSFNVAVAGRFALPLRIRFTFPRASALFIVIRWH
ncbi:hypothetical protein [Methanimicrococcus hongohii]|uniref:hypothetical protein n=1 Tax=Methanimicrococcus hongohii TaxID=3028295 RepID=UPI002930B6C2|nr:hypothetical protein [Methanimicrococcus sp. Hf6]